MTTIRPTTIPQVSDHEVTLTSPHLRVRTAPRFGAKLTELRSLRTGRDWLWKNPRQMLRQGKPFADYVGEFDTGGWDELFPTVSPVPPGVDFGNWGSEGLTDHGELWYRTWQTAQAGPHRCTQQVASPGDDFRFQRVLRLARECARVDVAYEVENVGDRVMPFLWAAHPLFRCEPGMSLEISPEVPIDAVHVWGIDSSETDRVREWGDLLDRLPVLAPAGGWADEQLNCGLAMKAFLRTGEGAPVSLADRKSSEMLSLAHGGGPVTHTAIWLNLGGWSGDAGEMHCNVGIEPTTFPADVPPSQPESAASLKPGEMRSWSLSLSIDRLPLTLE